MRGRANRRTGEPSAVDGSHSSREHPLRRSGPEIPLAPHDGGIVICHAFVKVARDGADLRRIGEMLQSRRRIRGTVAHLCASVHRHRTENVTHAERVVINDLRNPGSSVACMVGDSQIRIDARLQPHDV